MNIFKRLSTTIVSGINEAVGEIENHDALIKASITDRKKKLAAAKAQLARIQDSERKLKEQIAQLNINDRKWAQRALKEAEENEEQALTCMQRREKVIQQKDKLELMIREYQQTGLKMSKEVSRCEEDIVQLEQKHQIMRARQSSSDRVH